MTQTHVIPITKYGLKENAYETSMTFPYPNMNGMKPWQELEDT